jgi:hypothetical protein
MSWLSIIGFAIKIAYLLISRWANLDAVRKKEAEEILKEAKNVKDPSSVTRVFDKLSRL